jgi:hypothetical protein
METVQPGYAIIRCLAYLEHPRVLPGSLANSHFFDVTIRVFANDGDNPFVICSFHHMNISSSSHLSGLYEIEATVCNKLHTKPNFAYPS